MKMYLFFICAGILSLPFISLSAQPQQGSTRAISTPIERRNLMRSSLEMQTPEQFEVEARRNIERLSNELEIACDEIEQGIRMNEDPSRKQKLENALTICRKNAKQFREDQLEKLKNAMKEFREIYNARDTSNNNPESAVEPPPPQMMELTNSYRAGSLECERRGNSSDIRSCFASLERNYQISLTRICGEDEQCKNRMHDLLRKNGLRTNL